MPHHWFGEPPGRAPIAQCGPDSVPGRGHGTPCRLRRPCPDRAPILSALRAIGTAERSNKPVVRNHVTTRLPEPSSAVLTDPDSHLIGLSTALPQSGTAD